MSQIFRIDCDHSGTINVEFPRLKLEVPAPRLVLWLGINLEVDSN